jgi:hypothetical protein
MEYVTYAEDRILGGAVDVAVYLAPEGMDMTIKPCKVHSKDWLACLVKPARIRDRSTQYLWDLQRFSLIASLIPRRQNHVGIKIRKFHTEKDRLAVG